MLLKLFTLKVNFIFQYGLSQLSQLFCVTIFPLFHHFHSLLTFTLKQQLLKLYSLILIMLGYS